MSPRSAEKIEDEIRKLTQTERIRITQFFTDFDSLRTGFVTASRFFRCLWLTLGVNFVQEEEQLLIDKYDTNRNGTINYGLFCNVINKNFDPTDVRRDPSEQKAEPKELLGTTRTICPQSRESEDRLFHLLSRLVSYYDNRGINMKTCFEDFDQHHRGVISESQFYRNFPGPPDVSEEEMSMLVQKYKDPDLKGQISYLNLFHDILALGEQLKKAKYCETFGGSSLEQIPQKLHLDQSLNEIFDRIKIGIFKHGVRITDFFKDFDKLNHGEITENKFRSAIENSAGKEAQLTDREMQKIMEFYRTPGGKIRYKEFCDIIENAFTVAHLEKNPLEEVARPPRGALSRGVNQLSEEDEERVWFVIAKIAEQARRKRVLMYPFLKDYDRSVAYTKVITKNQFARSLQFLGFLPINERDLDLLAQKFCDPKSGDVNYPAFVQVIDPDYTCQTVGDVKLPDIPPEGNTAFPEPNPVTFDELMARIRHLILISRRKVNEVFEDYDPLRSGSITKNRFKRGLGILGFDKLGLHDINNSQFKMLCDHYKNPAKKDEILWVNFMKDVNSVFTQLNLEKMPMYRVPPSEVFRVPKPGTVDWKYASDQHVSDYENAMHRLRCRANQRRIFIEPVFRDFDRNNNGHITRHQFTQCMSMIPLPANEDEMAAIEARFCNDDGFNYMAFLQDLQPEVPSQYQFVERLKEIRMTNLKKGLPEDNVATNLDDVLMKAKIKVCRERMRLVDFMKDYDKLNSGRILKNHFRRALDLSHLGLKNAEVAILEDKYKSAEHPDSVNYLWFCDEIESALTSMHLDKDPLLDVRQFDVPVDWHLNELTPEEEESFQTCMQRIALKVRQHRMQLFPLFQDFDSINTGTVSRNQFRRVLMELELGNRFNEPELMLVWKKFMVKVGGQDDVQYIAFVHMIYQLAGFEWLRP